MDASTWVEASESNKQEETIKNKIKEEELLEVITNHKETQQFKHLLCSSVDFPSLRLTILLNSSFHLLDRSNLPELLQTNRQEK